MLLILVLLVAALSQLGGDGGGVLPGPNGPKTLLIVYEGGDATAPLGEQFVTLRHGPIADQLAKDGHRLLILDKDTKDERKQPLPLLAKFAPYATIPELVVTDLAGDRLIKRMPLPKTAAEVVEAAK
jgi:hypothetical protein